MSDRNYFIDPVLEEFPGTCGYRVFLCEGDDCIFDAFFAVRGDAEEFGEDFMRGVFADGFPLSVDKLRYGR